MAQESSSISGRKRWDVVINFRLECWIVRVKWRCHLRQSFSGRNFRWIVVMLERGHGLANDKLKLLTWSWDAQSFAHRNNISKCRSYREISYNGGNAIFFPETECDAKDGTRMASPRRACVRSTPFKCHHQRLRRPSKISSATSGFPRLLNQCWLLEKT